MVSGTRAHARKRTTIAEHSGPRLTSFGHPLRPSVLGLSANPRQHDDSVCVSTARWLTPCLAFAVAVCCLFVVAGASPPRTRPRPLRLRSAQRPRPTAARSTIASDNGTRPARRRTITRHTESEQEQLAPLSCFFFFFSSLLSHTLVSLFSFLFSCLCSIASFPSLLHPFFCCACGPGPPAALAARPLLYISPRRCPAATPFPSRCAPAHRSVGVPTNPLSWPYIVEHVTMHTRRANAARSLRPRSRSSC